MIKKLDEDLSLSSLCYKRESAIKPYLNVKATAIEISDSNFMIRNNNNIHLHCDMIFFERAFLLQDVIDLCAFPVDSKER